MNRGLFGLPTGNILRKYITLRNGQQYRIMFDTLVQYYTISAGFGCKLILPRTPTVNGQVVVFNKNAVILDICIEGQSSPIYSMGPQKAVFIYYSHGEYYFGNLNTTWYNPYYGVTGGIGFGLGWFAKIGGSYYDYFYDVAVSPIDGSIYAVGEENSSTGAYHEEAFITKWNPDGTLAWQRKIGGSYDDYFRGVAVSPIDGYIYAVGEELSSTGNNNYEAFITKWNPDGTLVWQRKIGGSYDDYLWRVAVSPIDGYIYAVGHEWSSRNGTTTEAFITKWNPDGTLAWQRKIGGSYYDYFYDVAVSPIDGFIYAVGYERSSTGNSNSEAFITKWNPDGTLAWQRKIGGSYDDSFHGVAVSPIDGSIYAVGYEYSSTNSDNIEAFITKWNPDGTLVWQRKIVGSYNDCFYGVTVSPIDGSIYAVGYERSSTGNDEAFITKWNPDGTLAWQRKIGGSHNEYFRDVAVSPIDGYIFAVGEERSSTGGTHCEAFITRWSPNGANLGTLPNVPQLSIGNPGLTVSTTSLSVSTTSLSVSTTSLSVSTTSFTVSTTNLSTQFSDFP